MEKVKLPRAVAKAIEHYSKPTLAYTKYGVLDCIVGESTDVALNARKALIENYDEGMCWDVLMNAIVNGYEVEVTAEDKVRDLYDNPDIHNYNPISWKMGIKVTLDALGIKIEGVNA